MDGRCCGFHYPAHLRNGVLCPEDAAADGDAVKSGCGQGRDVFRSYSAYTYCRKGNPFPVHAFRDLPVAVETQGRGKFVLVFCSCEPEWAAAYVIRP